MNTRLNISVVIADDESSIRNGLHSTIPWNKLNMTVIGIAKDGMEAWDFLQASRPDIVITDIRMPHLSGLDLIKKCRDSQIDTHFIILSGYDDFSYAQTAIRYGAKAYVLKPFKIEELMAELENLKEEIEQKHTTKQTERQSDDHSLHDMAKILFLNQLIHNEFHHSGDIKARCLDLSLNLQESPYQVLVFSFVHEKPKETFNLLTSAKNILYEQVTSHHGHLWNSGESYLVVFLPSSPDEAPSFVNDFANGCLQQLKQHKHSSVCVGIGSVENELTCAGHSYGMALTALSYQLYESGQDVYDQAIICNHAPTLSASNIDTKILISAIRKNDVDSIRSYCHSFFQTLRYVSMPPPSFIRGMSIYLITDVQNALRAQMEEESNLFTELSYVKINQMTTLRQIMDWTHSLFLQYGETASSHLSNRKDHIITEAKRFIKEHMNRKIQAEDVASVVNLSPSYFAIYFKSKTGINFRDYVLSVKMEHAKHLLETANANISEVSYSVGYDDYRSFYRAFKNHTALTPSEYQAKH